MSEKTEKPTPKKLRDARRKGQVAKSKEIATCAVIVGLFAYFWLFFDDYLERLQYLVQIPAQYYHLPFERAMISSVKAGFQEFAILILPLAITALLITILSYMMQIGFLVAFEPIKPDFKRLSPVQGVKRIFSLSNLLELGKSVVKILLLGAIIYLLIRSNVKNLLHIPEGDPEGVVGVLAAILKQLAVAVSSLFIIVAILDHFFQKHLHIKKLKMSKDEIKREHKDREGDPHLKQRRRQLQMEAAMDDMATKIKQSTVVLTHPSKLVVVLYYEMGKTVLPIISLKGKNIMYDKIVTMAKQHGIPVMTETTLTRDLYDKGEQDNYIESDFIEPVARILRNVMGLESEPNNIFSQGGNDA